LNIYDGLNRVES